MKDDIQVLVGNTFKALLGHITVFLLLTLTKALLF